MSNTRIYLAANRLKCCTFSNCAGFKASKPALRASIGSIQLGDLSSRRTNEKHQCNPQTPSSLQRRVEMTKNWTWNKSPNFYLFKYVKICAYLLANTSHGDPFFETAKFCSCMRNFGPWSNMHIFIENNEHFYKRKCSMK